MSIGPRRIAELLGRGRVVKRHLRVSGRREPIYVSPDAQLKYALPGQRGLDRDLIVVAEIFVSEGMAVWDVGANVGIFAIAAASRSGSGAVLAIEADPWLAELIDRTRRHPKHRERSIQVLCAAISDSDGVDEFVIAERGRASNALKGVGRSQMGGARQTRMVPTLRLDSIARQIGAPRFIKIDVEGAEAKLFEGAGKLLREHKPVIYAEIGRESWKAVSAKAADLGYRIFDSFGQPSSTRNDSNYFLIHADDEDSYQSLQEFARRR